MIIDVLERWESEEQVEAFRGSGPADEQQGEIRDGQVAQYVVTSGREQS